MPRETVVGKQKLAVDDRRRRHVLADHRRDERAGLHAHALHQIVVETVFGIEADVGLVAAEVPQIEPVVGEVVDEARTPRVVEKPVDLRAEHLGAAQIAACSLGDQVAVGPRVPEEIGEPLGERHEVSGAAGIIEIEKLRAAEHRPIPGEHRLRKPGAAAKRGDDQGFVGRDVFLGQRRHKRGRGEPTEEPPRVGLGVARQHLDSGRRSRGSGAKRKVVKEHPVRRRRPGLRWQRAGDFQRLEGDAGMAARRQRGEAIGGLATVHISRERHGQTEQAVFDRLASLQEHGRLVVAAFGRNVEEPTHGLHVAGDVGPGRRAGPERHRHRLRRRHEREVFHLVHGAGLEPHAVDAAPLGHESARIAVIRPVGGAEDRALDAGVVGLRLIDLLRLLGEELCHRLAEGLAAEEVRRDRRERVGRLRRHAVGDRRAEGGLGGVERRLELDPREVETLGRLVEAVAGAVFRQPVADVEIRQEENIAERVLVFAAVEPAERHASVGRDVGPVGLLDEGRQRGKQGGPLVVWQVAGIGRHLSLRHAVVHEGELLADARIGEIGAEGGDRELALGRVGVVAVEAGGFEVREHVRGGHGRTDGIGGLRGPAEKRRGRAHGQRRSQHHHTLPRPAAVQRRTSVTMWAARITAGASRSPSASESRGAGAVIQSDAIGISLASKIGAPRQWWPSIVSPRSIA